MQRHGHLSPAPEIKTELLAMSAATIDRALRPVREKAKLGAKRRRPSSALRRSVPVRTFADWQDARPGFVEADLVAHSGPSSRGGFLYTFVLTDVATGWTECAPLLVREQKLLSEVLTELRKQLPFPLLGLDTDNDTVFLNETIKAYCDEAGVVFTRCRPYKKNDQAFVEQKNGAIVRRMVGYRRFEGLAAAATLAQLYRAVRLFVNFFQPSFKLLSKEREGALVRKRYDAASTPSRRRPPAGDGTRTLAGDLCRPRSNRAVARNPRLPKTARRPGRCFSARTGENGSFAVRAIFVGLAVRLEGGASAADRPSQAEPETRATSPRSARCRHATATRLVLGRALAIGRRIAREAARRISWRLSRPAAAHSAAETKNVAQRARS
jgi:hypothetical protein